jgi:hypothetical protein
LDGGGGWRAGVGGSTWSYDMPEREGAAHKTPSSRPSTHLGRGFA